MKKLPYSRVVLIIAFILIGPTLAFQAAQSVTGYSEQVPSNQPTDGMLPTFIVKASIPTDYGGYRDSVFDAVQNRLYIVYASDTAPLISIDPDTAKIIGIGDLPLLLQIAVSADGERLYASTQFPETNGDNAILVLDSHTLEIIDSFSYPCNQSDTYCPVGSLVVGPEDRLYATNDGRNIQVFDGTTGEILGEIVVEYPNMFNGYVVHGDKLYLADQMGYQGHPGQLIRYDISEVEPVLELSVPLTFDAPVDSISNDGRYLLLGRGYPLYLYDTETLQQIREYGDLVNVLVDWAFSSNSEGLITATAGPYDRYLLREYTIASGELVKSGITQGSSQLWEIIGLPDDELATVYYSEVQLVWSLDHSLILPVTFNNYCGGGIVTDQFDDPTSGWPSLDNEYARFGYDQGEYRTTIRVQPYWLGVSRGDYWHNAGGVHITINRVVEKGFAGLIFGLNEDWTDFYTFEAYIHLGRWAIYHYTEANGWKLIQTDTFNIGQTPLELTIDRQDNDMSFRAGGTGYTMPQVSGRVGLVVGSVPPTEPDEWVPFDVWFDNYLFVGQNCNDYQYRGVRADFSMSSIPRSSLEKLLLND